MEDHAVGHDNRSMSSGHLEDAKLTHLVDLTIIRRHLRVVSTLSSEHIFRGGRERGPERASGVQFQSADTISSNEHSPSVAMGSLTRCSGKTEAVITRCGSHEASPDRTVYPRSWHVHRRLNYARYRPPCRKNRLPGHSCSICRRGPKLGIEQQEGIRATS